MAELVPDQDRDVYLFVTPPKVQRIHHSDEPRVIQCQRIVRAGKQTSTAGDGTAEPLRIRPVLNLEFHRFANTRVVELEQDDIKICEFETRRAVQPPVKVRSQSPSAIDDSGRGSDDSSSAESTHGASSNQGSNTKVRRKRKSITGLKRSGSISDRKAARLGGRVVSSHDRGLEMTVRAWPDEGIYEFVPPGPPSDVLTWKRRVVDSKTEWALVRQDNNDELQPPGIPPIHRSDSSDTQYTDILDDDESSLSRAATDETSTVVRRRSSAAETVLSATPVPHLSHYDPGRPGPRSSMAEVRDRRRRQYRMLVSALWIVWCADEFTKVGDATDTSPPVDTVTAAQQRDPSPQQKQKSQRQSVWRACAFCK